MATLSRFLAAAVHTELRSALPDLSAAVDDLVPQVFPVRMRGSRHDPPHQAAHLDHSHGETPTVTSIYYPEVLYTEGGALVLFDEDGLPQDRVEPVSDLLVVMDGRTVHAVEPLVGGRRTSLVVNFYRMV